MGRSGLETVRMMSIQTIYDHNSRLPQSSEGQDHGPKEKAHQNDYLFNHCLHDYLPIYESNVERFLRAYHAPTPFAQIPLNHY